MRRWLLATLITAQGCTSSDTAGTSTDTWVGRWNGPEGTYLTITGADGAYEVTIKDLDAARTFDGSAVGDGIEFRRDGGDRVDQSYERRRDWHEVVGRQDELPHCEARRRLLPRLSEPKGDA